MTEIANVDARDARSVAGRIRQGIRDYLATLALVKRAWDEEHWRVLGYDSWQGYVDGEFGAERLGLPDEHRDKALTDLRMAGMSVRAIAATTGVPKSTVADELGRLSEAGQLDKPDAIRSLDGRERPSTRPSSPTGPTDAHEASPGADRSGHQPPAATGEAHAGLDREGAGNTVASEAPSSVPLVALDGAGVDAAGSDLGPVETAEAAWPRVVTPAASGGGTDAAGDTHDPAEFAAALDRLVPDSNPHREWQRRFLDAISGVHKVMRFTPADVAEKADELCIDELVRVFEQFDDYRTRVIEARISNLPDNVTPIRRIS